MIGNDWCSASYIFVSPFVLFPLAIVLSDLLRFTDSDYPFGIIKLFFGFLSAKDF
jgi:hypothetical protein